MKAAIYARKSNKDDRSEENKSTGRQIERSGAFAAAHGWTVDPEHIFKDEDISGAEFERRPGLARLVAAAEQKRRPFDVLIMSELSRLGRDQVHNAAWIARIRDTGVRIFYYLSGQEEIFDTPEQRFMAMAMSFGAEIERAMIGQRTRDALSRKAEQGKSAGGRCYGYDNVWVFPDGRRESAPIGAKKADKHAYTDWVINEEQAEVVRAVFRAYDAGHGIGLIAKVMNGQPGARYDVIRRKFFGGKTPGAPQWGRQGTGSWAPTGIRAMLARSRYAGVVAYGQYKNERGAGGRATKCVKQDKPLVEVAREDLRIIDADLWARVQKRLGNVREFYMRTNGGQLLSRPETGRASKYLLSGLARCGAPVPHGEGEVCGHNITVAGGNGKINYYGCQYNQARGDSVCANDHRGRMSEIDAMVLEAIERQVLTPDAVTYVVEKAATLIAEKRRQDPGQVKDLDTNLRNERRRLSNLIDLAAEGKAPASVLSRIKEHEARIAHMERERAAMDTREPTELDLRRLRKDLAARMGSFKDLIFSDVPLARQALRKLLRDRAGNFAPLLFVPVVRDGRKTYDVRGSVNLNPLFNNIGTEERT